MKKKRNTVILTVVLLAAALGGFLVQRLFFHVEGSYARIQSYGRELARLPLFQDAVFLVGDERQGYNRVEVKNGAVSVAEADCPNKLCVRAGAKKYSGDVIACLPHELIVTVVGGYEDAADAVTW